MKQIALFKQATAVEPQNPELTFYIAEGLRSHSWRLPDDYEALAREARTWFERGRALNPYDARNLTGIGMCDDWLNEFAPAEKLFLDALKLDPNGANTVARVGWHYLQTGDFVKAKQYLERSVRLLNGWGDEFAQTHLEAANRRLKESGQLRPGAK